MEFLKRIQSKSSETKAKYAFAFALSVTIIIAVVWTTTLPARFSEITQKSASTAEETSDSLSGFFDEVNNQAASLGELKEEIQEQVKTANLDALNFTGTTTATSSENGTTTPEEQNTENVFETPEQVSEKHTASSTLAAPYVPKTILIEVKEQEKPPVSNESPEVQ